MTEVKTASKTPAQGMPKYIKIVLEDSDNFPPTGLPLSLNGRAYIVKPGVPVSVPPGVIEILDNAIISVPEINPLTKQISHWRDRLRFPYRVIRED